MKINTMTEIDDFGLPEMYQSGKICLWLDDVRNPIDFGYEGALWVRSAQSAIRLLTDNFGLFCEASLDHDLLPGDGNGYDVIRFMEDSDCWPPGGVRVHSSNAPARERMLVLIRAHYGRNFQLGLYADGPFLLEKNWDQ